jgi:hypothetical protein
VRKAIGFFFDIPREKQPLQGSSEEKSTFGDFVKSLLECHPGESRGPELVEITGFRLSPE